jgi:hypothetical protein
VHTLWPPSAKPACVCSIKFTMRACITILASDPVFLTQLFTLSSHSVRNKKKLNLSCHEYSWRVMARYSPTHATSWLHGWIQSHSCHFKQYFCVHMDTECYLGNKTVVNPRWTGNTEGRIKKSYIHIIKPNKIKNINKPLIVYLIFLWGAGHLNTSSIFVSIWTPSAT